VTEVELLEALLELARDTGLPVRLVGRAGEEGSAASAPCRVRGRWWVVLSRSDPPGLQIDALARALRQHAGEQLESRWLPPAVRHRLEGA